MKLLIKFPTRSRKNKFLLILKKYYNFLSKRNDVHFLISMDEDDVEMNNDFVREILGTYQNLSFFYGNSKTKVEAINNDLDKINEWDIVLLASDDMIPTVKGYDDIIINEMKNNYPDTDGVLWFNDGYQGDKLNTLCILGKKYYDRFGYIYNPEYKSVWSDNEFMLVANILGKQKYFDNVIIKHEHPDWGFGSRDEIHTTNIKNESLDRNTFNKRKLNNFGI
jgi:hypothetical protein